MACSENGTEEFLHTAEDRTRTRTPTLTPPRPPFPRRPKQGGGAFCRGGVYTPSPFDSLNLTA